MTRPGSDDEDDGDERGEEEDRLVCTHDSLGLIKGWWMGVPGLCVIPSHSVHFGGKPIAQFSEVHINLSLTFPFLLADMEDKGSIPKANHMPGASCQEVGLEQAGPSSGVTGGSQAPVDSSPGPSHWPQRTRHKHLFTLQTVNSNGTSDCSLYNEDTHGVSFSCEPGLGRWEVGFSLQLYP